MNVERIDVTARVITGAMRAPGLGMLDPITVITRTIRPGVGSLTITVYGRAWTAYWGAMGVNTVEEFIAGCDADYLEGCLVRGSIQGLKKGERNRRDYLIDVITAVKSALEMEPGVHP